jgi:hypothetical protein
MYFFSNESKNVKYICDEIVSVAAYVFPLLQMSVNTNTTLYLGGKKMGDKELQHLATEF